MAEMHCDRIKKGAF